MAVTFEFGCEISFPVSENSTIAYLGLVGNLTNFVQTIPEILLLQVFIITIH
jgi:MFS transporter, FLVCR family, feline leukemia virus subgroup C receptor-related protein